jgi:hypothetical protein
MRLTQPAFRIDAVEPCRSKQRVNGGCTLATESPPSRSFIFNECHRKDLELRHMELNIVSRFCEG